MLKQLDLLFSVICCGLVLLLHACSSSKMSNHQQRLDLYLLVGQSNMAGRGFLEKEDTTFNAHVFMFDKNDSFVLAREPLHYDKKSRGTGPGLAFGKEMAKKFPNNHIGLIPAAVGGTKISYWHPDNKRGLYKEAIRKAKAASKYGSLKGILWQQGESDCNTIDAPLYGERLTALIKNLRKDLDAPNLPIVIGGLGGFLKAKDNRAVVEKALIEVASEIGNAKFSAASGLGHIGDSLHFNSKAQRENGRRMAAGMMSLLK